MKWFLLLICLSVHLSAFSGDWLTLKECQKLVKKGRGVEAMASLQHLFSEQTMSAEWNEDEFVTTFSLLSAIYSAQGMPNNVIAICNDARRVFSQKSSKSNTEFSRSLRWTSGQAQMFLKNYDSAIEDLSQAQSMYEDKYIFDNRYFSILTSLAVCHFEKKDYATSKLYLDEAEEMHLKYFGDIMESSLPDSYQLLNCKGFVCHYFGDDLEAERCYQSVIRSSPKDSLLESTKDFARNNLAQLYVQQGKYAEAVPLLNSVKSATPVGKYTNAINMSFEALTNNRYDAAIDCLDSFNTEIIDYLQHVIFYYTELDRENYWSVIAYQLMANNNSVSLYTDRADALRGAFETNSFVRDFNLNFQQLMKRTYLKYGSPERRATWARYLAQRAMASYGYETKERHDSIERELTATEQRILSQTKLDIREYLKENYNTDKMREKLRAGEAIIDYVSVGTPKGPALTNEYGYDYAAYTLTAESPAPRLTKVCSQNDAASLVYRPTADEEFINRIYTESADSLYKLVIEPLLPAIKGKTRLYIRPVGVLSAVNFGAIPMPDGKLLGDEYDVVMVSNFEDIKGKTGAKYSDIALFGAPDFFGGGDNLAAAAEPAGDEYEMISRGVRGNWGPLPGTRTEVESVAKIASGKNIGHVTYIGRDASEAMVKSLSGKSPSIMHIATHGYFLTDEDAISRNGFLRQTLGTSQKSRLMQMTGLLLSGANEVWNGRAKPNPVDDGVLTADEISRLDFSRTRLVVLSACDTGKGFINYVDGALGLQRAFRSAGAGTMVMSLWQVPDEATSRLMQYFYTHLFEGQSVRDALRAAQRQLRGDGYTDPYYWAAFIAVD